ncbi:hypothetical protein GR11A_00030 [Vibrio phage vB_VcorM_GR11A]|nr:hypothetical protein GR11A_00030 [Vibrio phage vB_VcorM_GR11A]
MGIKRLQVSTFSKLDAAKFRNLSEVSKSLENLSLLISDDDQLLDGFNKEKACRNIVVSGNSSYLVREGITSNKVYDYRAHLPNVPQLDKYFAILSVLQDQFILLESLENVVKYSFRDDPSYTQTLIELERVKTILTLRLSEYKNLLEMMHESYQSAAYTGLVNKVFDTIVSDLMGRVDYSCQTSMVDVYADSGSSIRYSTYLELSNLVDTTGFAYKNYCIVVTIVKDASGTDSFYVTTLPGFRTPSTFSPGIKFNSVDEAITTTRSMLTKEGLL